MDYASSLLLFRKYVVNIRIKRYTIIIIDYLDVFSRKKSYLTLQLNLIIDP